MPAAIGIERAHQVQVDVQGRGQAGRIEQPQHAIGELAGLQGLLAVQVARRHHLVAYRLSAAFLPTQLIDLEPLRGLLRLLPRLRRALGLRRSRRFLHRPRRFAELLARLRDALAFLLATELPLENLADALREAGAEDVRISEDAGGYVCERTYYLVLQRAKDAGVPGLFLHVPPVASAGVSAQRPIVEALLRAVVLAL